jgi:beta-keto acid cleavage enzyme
VTSRCLRRPPPDAPGHDGRNHGRQRPGRLEDSIYLGRGQLATSNAEQVSRIRAILEGLSLEIATPAEARAQLNLGGDQVGF